MFFLTRINNVAVEANVEKRNMFRTALAKGIVDQATKLLEQGVDVLSDEKEGSVFHLAVAANSATLIEVLLKHQPSRAHLMEENALGESAVEGEQLKLYSLSIL